LRQVIEIEEETSSSSTSSTSSSEYKTAAPLQEEVKKEQINDEKPRVDKGHIEDRSSGTESSESFSSTSSSESSGHVEKKDDSETINEETSHFIKYRSNLLYFIIPLFIAIFATVFLCLNINYRMLLILRMNPSTSANDLILRVGLLTSTNL